MRSAWARAARAAAGLSMVGFVASATGHDREGRLLRYSHNSANDAPET